MSQIDQKKKPRDIIRAARILRTAKITGVSPRQVRRVCDGENSNDEIVDTMVRLKQAEDYLDNMLLREVNKLLS